MKLDGSRASLQGKFDLSSERKDKKKFLNRCTSFSFSLEERGERKYRIVNFFVFVPIIIYRVSLFVFAVIFRIEDGIELFP